MKNKELESLLTQLHSEKELEKEQEKIRKRRMKKERLEDREKQKRRRRQVIEININEGFKQYEAEYKKTFNACANKTKEIINRKYPDLKKFMIYAPLSVEHEQFAFAKLDVYELIPNLRDNLNKLNPYYSIISNIKRELSGMIDKNIFKISDIDGDWDDPIGLELKLVKGSKLNESKDIIIEDDDEMKVEEEMDIEKAIADLEPALQEYADLLRDDLFDYESLLEESSPEKGYKSGANDTCPAGHQWVYMFLVNAKLPTTKVIKHFTKQPYNHSALSFDKSLTKMYSFSIGGGHNGFVTENIYNVYKPDAEFSLYKIAVPHDALIAMKDAINNVDRFRDQYKYSTIGLLGFIFKKHQDKFNTREKALFCSQFCARMFASAGMKIFNKEDYEIRPYDFAKNKNFKFCYRGTVKDFNPTRIR